MSDTNTQADVPDVPKNQKHLSSSCERVLNSIILFSVYTTVEISQFKFRFLDLAYHDRAGIFRVIHLQARFIRERSRERTTDGY